jgi:hypothetical protein
LVPGADLGEAHAADDLVAAAVAADEVDVENPAAFKWIAADRAADGRILGPMLTFKKNHRKI